MFLIRAGAGASFPKLTERKATGIDYGLKTVPVINGIGSSCRSRPTW